MGKVRCQIYTGVSQSQQWASTILKDYSNFNERGGLKTGQKFSFFVAKILIALYVALGEQYTIIKKAVHDPFNCTN